MDASRAIHPCHPGYSQNGSDDAARLVAGELGKCTGVERDIIDITKLPLSTNDSGEAIKQADFSAKMGMRRIGYTTNTKPRPRYEPRAREHVDRGVARPRGPANETFSSQMNLMLSGIT